MPRNLYISHGTDSEQDLLADLIAESIQVYGHDVVYIPRNIVNLDGILNEDVLSNFTDAYVCEMYVESFDGFEGDGKLISKFGLEIRDQLTLVVSARRWRQLVGRFMEDPKKIRPREGDLIYMPMTKGLFEVKYVEDKKPFYQLNDLPTYKLTVELFEYANQDIDTGIEEIDNIQSGSSMGFSVLVDFPSDDLFSVGETLTILLPDGTSADSELLNIEDSSAPSQKHLYVGPLTFEGDEFKSINSAISISGGDITASVISVATVDDKSNFQNDPTAQNNEFEEAGVAFIDFSETNPFGE